VDAPAYQILKNLNIISTGVLYRIFLKKKSVLLMNFGNLCFTPEVVTLKEHGGILFSLCFGILAGLEFYSFTSTTYTRADRNVIGLVAYHFFIGANLIELFFSPPPSSKASHYLLFRLSEIQWAAFILLCAGCTTAQLNPS
jgi:hypothetical protein